MRIPDHHIFQISKMAKRSQAEEIELFQWKNQGLREITLNCITIKFYFSTDLTETRK